MKHHPFPARLALARSIIVRGTAPAPVHLADQIGAAGAEARTIHDNLGIVLPFLDPDRNWRARVDWHPADDTRAYLLAALIGCTTVCPHLKRGGPQPGIARLPLHRIDCGRCSQTLRRPPAEDDDRCDVCGRPEVLTFFPFALRSGPLLVAGDACPECADVLGIAREVAS